MARLASSTTLNFASRGSLMRSRPTINPPIISDEDMAWLLVDAAKSVSTGYERTIVFVELGCGESYLAIKRILTALLSTRMALPVAILSKLTGWLNGYAGSPEEPQLRMMLAVIRPAAVRGGLVAAMTEAYVLGGVRTPFTRYGGTCRVFGPMTCWV